MSVKSKSNSKKNAKNEPVESFLTIDYYKLQIDELTLKLSKIKEENESLKGVLSKYEDTMKASLNDKKDIIEYLGRELQNKVDEINDLKDRFNYLTTMNKNTRINLETEIKEKERTFEEKIEKLNNENLILSSKLSMVDNFIKEKTLLDKKLNEQMETIENLKKQNEENVYELEKSFLIEKTKLRSEMIEKLNELANEFRNAFHQQMNNTTKKIIKENYSLNLDLKKLAQTADKLLNENQNLKETSLKNRLELEMNEKNMNDLTKKFETSIKTIQIMSEKETLNENLDFIFENYSNEIKKLRQENQDLKQEVTTLQKDLINSEQFYGKDKNVSCECQIDFQTIIKSRNRFVTILKDTADKLIRKLIDEGYDSKRESLKLYVAELAEIVNRVELIKFEK
ncbi:unnamed protein product [Brachionus calyciflorus]|uniref:Cilia- and flagella-associated protein 157 n=1 Tax=Brachionus calyciflorus TaxID=104777 RepID=A0A814GQT5_9BILA|nr:unnamed protein product [Brachionus calyciflorus]